MPLSTDSQCDMTSPVTGPSRSVAVATRASGTCRVGQVSRQQQGAASHRPTLVGDGGRIVVALLVAEPLVVGLPVAEGEVPPVGGEPEGQLGPDRPASPDPGDEGDTRARGRGRGR